MKLTPAMRETLQRAKTENGLRRVHDNAPGRPAWPAHHNTIRALIDRGHLTHKRRRSRQGHPTDEWLITQNGLDALEPTIVTRTRRPLYIAEGWPDYTSDSGRKAKGEPEAVPPGELNPAWKIAALERQADALERRHQARLLAQRRRVA